MQRLGQVGLRQTVIGSKSGVTNELCRSASLSWNGGDKQHGESRPFTTSASLLTPKVDPKKDYYSVLGVTPTCSAAKVKAAFFRLSKIHHPDINKSEEAAQMFHELSEAHEILSNKRLRHQYEEGRRMHSGTVHRGMRSQHFKHYNATGPMQQKNAEDEGHFDGWMDNHYSDLFAKSQKQREKFRQDIYQKEVERKAIMKKEGVMAFPTGFKVTYGNAAVAATTLLSAIYLIVHLATDTDV